MRDVVAAVIGGGLYAMALLGIAMIFGSELYALYRRIRMQNRLAESMRRHKKPGALESHLDQMLKITLSGKVRYSWFLGGSSLLCLGVTTVGMRSMPFFFALMTGAILSAFPYLILRIRLESLRKKSSYEGEVFIGNFLSAYRVAGFNLYKAMEEIGRERGKTKNCAALTSRMLYELRNTANAPEIKRAAEKFAYAIHTNWARMFAYNIWVAASGGTNISLALEDILLQLREATAISEERRRMNSESTRMVVFLIPVLYVATVFMSVNAIGISLGTFLRNQFLTAQGFLMLLLAIFLFLVNLVLIEMVNNQKFDF